MSGKGGEWSDLDLLSLGGSYAEILEAIKDEEIRPNHVGLNGHLLVWDTTPEELQLLATAFKESCKRPGDMIYVHSSGDNLHIGRKGRYDGDEWELGVETPSAVYAEVTSKIKVWTTVTFLTEAARELAKAPWEKPKRHDTVQRYDQRVIKATVGDDIVTICWTPPLDREGVPQLSPMQRAAFHGVQNRAFVESVAATRRRLGLDGFTGPINNPFDDQVVGSAAAS